MRHVISVLLQNEVGALTRMTGLFSNRGYNIETLNVAPTDDPVVSRVTLVVEGSDAAIAQLNTQLAKLVDVVNIHDMTLGEHFERELAIVKMKLQTGGYVKVVALAKEFDAEILDDSGREVLDEYIAFLNQAFAEFEALGIGQIERESPFVGVGRERDRAALPPIALVHIDSAGHAHSVGTLDGFDLDDVGAESREHLAG